MGAISAARPFRRRTNAGVRIPRGGIARPAATGTAGHSEAKKGGHGYARKARGEMPLGCGSFQNGRKAEFHCPRLASIRRAHHEYQSSVFQMIVCTNQATELLTVTFGHVIVEQGDFERLITDCRIHELLQRILGKKTLENEILKEAVEYATEKKWIARSPLLPGDGE